MDARDMDLRRAALDAVRRLSARHDDLVPVEAMRDGFSFKGKRVSFGSFYSGIFRPKEAVGPAALCIVTAPPKNARDAPYEDGFDEATQRFVYHYRTARSETAEARFAAARDNASLVAALRLNVPLIHFHGVAPGQYSVLAPVFVTRDDPTRRIIEYEAALPVADATDSGLISPPDVRRYATREAVVRLHQHQFRRSVLRAYGTRCAVCRLRESVLLEAAHITEDGDEQGHAVVSNGIALCAIHHLAYDRNLMGITPDGVVHIAHRLLDEIDGPMLRVGLQGFHEARMSQPRRQSERPDRERLEARFERFQGAA